MMMRIILALWGGLQRAKTSKNVKCKKQWCERGSVVTPFNLLDGETINAYEILMWKLLVNGKFEDRRG
jgi:hypothetical protein